MSALASRFGGARFMLSAAAPAQVPPPERGEVAFAGRSNAGKSSALNAICGHGRLARVSKTPGRTQCLNFFELPKLGRIVDLPGYGYADAPAELRRGWGHLIGSYLETRENLRGLVVVMDARHPLKTLDHQLLGWAQSLGLPCHVLLTKSDKLTRSESAATLKQVSEALAQLQGAPSAQLFSATNQTGVDDARRRIVEWLAD